MPRTRAFKSGNSQAIRIPADLAYDNPAAELTITRTGDVITIFPARQSLRHAVALLRAMPVPDAGEAHEPTDVPDRGRI